MSATAKTAVLDLVESQLQTLPASDTITNVEHIFPSESDDSTPILRVWVTDRLAEQELKGQLNRIETPVYIDIVVK